MKALIASDLCKRTERMIIKELTEALLEAALSPSLLENSLQYFSIWYKLKYNPNICHIRQFRCA